MNREDIQRFATQARLPQNYMTGEAMWLDRLEDFAALVSAAERERFNALLEDYHAVLETLEEMQAAATAAVASEREACAKLADDKLMDTSALMSMPPKSSAAWSIAAAIRARG